MQSCLTNNVYQNENWSPSKMFKSDFIVEQFKAPNAVNAAEAAERERKEKEAEEARIAAEEAERLAEEKQINDILGPASESEDELPAVDPRDEMAEAKPISFSEEAAAFDHDAEALAAGLESLEEGENDEDLYNGMDQDIELRLEGGESSAIVGDGGEGVGRAEALLFNYEE
uniref:Uncharacterized protein n=1 Tax=Lotharella globosa TaxID=91324 RepID=A0A7S4DJ34_9EUKA